MAVTTHECDVLVVGGGINGAGIARDTAGRGWSTVLCEKDDLAGHTSSASTKLIHGGLRYLEHYEFGLVRKALAEREVLLRSAPHVIWPLEFIMPHHSSHIGCARAPHHCRRVTVDHGVVHLPGLVVTLVPRSDHRASDPGS